MRINVASLNNLEAICLLAEEVASDHHQNHPNIFAPPAGIERDQAHWAALLESPDARTFIAINDSDAVVGFLVAKKLQPTLSFLQPRCICHVGTIVVAHHARRQGIGAAMIKKAEQWAREIHANELRLEVFEFNTGAIALYESMGLSVRSKIMSKELTP